MDVTRAQAEEIVSGTGWLSRMSPVLRATVLRHSILMNFSHNEHVFRYGDPPGGIYGLVVGTVTVNTAPPNESPQLVHLGAPGDWAGEECFITRQSRRSELRASGSLWMMHIPLDTMDRMAAADPGAVRAFAMISVLGSDVLIRVIHDLQRQQADRRIAAVLQRATWIGRMPIPLSQADLGVMANASRQQVNAALRRFASAGWIEHQYRSITVKDADALYRFASTDDGR